MSQNENPSIRTIMVKLNDQEINERAELLVAAMSKVEAIEADKKAAMTVYNERIEEGEGEVQKLKRAIETHSEERKVECVSDPDYRAGKMRYLHPETKELLGERELTQDELQVSFGDHAGTPGARMADEPPVKFDYGVCRFCGCTNDTACVVEGGERCGWITESNATCCTKASCKANWEEIQTPPQPEGGEPLELGQEDGGESNVTPIGGAKKKKGKKSKAASA